MNNSSANCRVLQLGNRPEDHAHVSRSTPMDLKRKEIQNDPRYKTEFENGIDPKREASATKQRRSGHVRPLGGR